MKKILFFVFFYMLLSFPSVIFAQEKNQFITIVNPVRISIYSLNPPLSLTNQYNQVKLHNLPASWLFTYDAISYPGISKIVKSMDKNQDIGIFMEVTESFSQAAGVKYNKTDSWHRSTSIFLSGYSQSDRRKFIDTVFNKFKDEVGYYPSSVGAWWIDSYSLEYMQKKYGVTANLIVSDQLDTDGYTIWGQFWGAPFYPSKNHTAIPAQSLENKIDVVNIQWAPRDPLNGYLSPTGLRSSLYSTQDYRAIGLTEEYLEKLINLYAKQNNNEFGQITFGLEGDFNPETYTSIGQFGEYIKLAKKFQDTGEFTIYNMGQFSKWYRKKYLLSPAYLIKSDDLLGKKKAKAIWYQTSSYRVGLIIDQTSKTLQIVDLKIYFKNFQEPFFVSSNKQLDLYIKVPSVIDIADLPLNFMEFKNVSFVDILKNNNSFRILLDNNRSIDFEDEEIRISNFNEDLPQFILKSPYIKLTKENKSISIITNKEFPHKEDGYIFKDLTIESTYFLKQKKVIVVIFGAILFFILIASFINRLFPKAGKLFLLVLLILIFYSYVDWYSKNSENYYVSQSEIDALLKLKSLPGNRVLILDKDCLQCNWKTKYKVAAFANKRGYIKKISHKDLVFDEKLIEFHASSLDNFTKIKREDAKKYLKKLKTDYVYLVKHEDYQEKTPYSPGDLGIEKVFVNSDAEVWRVR